MNERPVGVLVMAYGTPSTRDDVAAYYTRIRHGHPPTPELLADLVRRYDAIGGTSPLAERTAAQVRALADVLDATQPGRFDVRFGAKYEPPLIEDTARALREDGVTTVIGLALAPHSSSMSTAQYMSRARDALGDDATLIAIDAWWDAPGFLDLIAARVSDALTTIDVERRADAYVLFSAHSLPQRILDEGDTYPDQLRESARDVARRASLAHWGVAWQSAGRTADAWLGPDILSVLRTVRATGVRDLVSCPIGFVADHLEVLFDIDVEAQGVAREIGLNLVRTASLNDDPAFIAVLADVVRGAL